MPDVSNPLEQVKMVDISKALSKDVSPELRKYVLPWEKTFVYTMKADDSDEKLKEIAITQDKYAHLEKILRPSWAKNVKTQESFYQ